MNNQTLIIYKFSYLYQVLKEVEYELNLKIVEYLDEQILKNEIKILEERYSRELNVPKNTISFTVFTYDTENVFYDGENIDYKEYFPI